MSVPGRLLRRGATIALAIVALVGGVRAPTAFADDPAPLVPSEVPADVAAIRVGIDADEFVRARNAIDGLYAAEPKPSPAREALLLDLRARLAARRNAWFRGRALEGLVVELTRALKARAEVEGAAYNDIQAWMRKEWVEVAFHALTVEFQKKDPAVTPEETKAFFDARPRTDQSWRSCSYGSATWLVVPPNGMPARGMRPTRDTWWKEAPLDDRIEFWFAAGIERSSLFETRLDPKGRACPSCDGKGHITKRLSNRSELTYLCPRCGGLKVDRVVEYR